MSDQDSTPDGLADSQEHSPPEPYLRNDDIMARTIAQMLMEGSVAVDLSLENLRQAESRSVSHLLRLKPDSHLSAPDSCSNDSDEEFRALADGQIIAFSAVGKVEKIGNRVTLTVTLLHNPADKKGEETCRGAPRLQKWRLMRVVKFVEEQIAEPITLHDLAAVSGLSPNYFGAQFRAATGLSPWEYVMRKRIERAQELLVSTDDPVIAVALNVGFQTHAHFTSVFGRIVGHTPSLWRRRCLWKAPPNQHEYPLRSSLGRLHRAVASDAASAASRDLGHSQADPWER